MENKILPELQEGCSYGDFGREIYQDKNGDWFYKEDNTPTSIKKPCPKCNEFKLDNGNDPCLGDLPGVIGACCGHGKKEQQGYILFENGVRIILNNAEITKE